MVRIERRLKMQSYSSQGRGPSGPDWNAKQRDVDQAHIEFCASGSGLRSANYQSEGRRSSNGIRRLGYHSIGSFTIGRRRVGIELAQMGRSIAGIFRCAVGGGLKRLRNQTRARREDRTRARIERVNWPVCKKSDPCKVSGNAASEQSREVWNLSMGMLQDGMRFLPSKTPAWDEREDRAEAGPIL
ncbi:hypothetical protein ZIOFF_057068 [Zingiber officinale]|uniref:Uncharacterized protein n=1 Tax=Zingiber officinale TaxID=94328 RepID=A0A8J5FZ05_ZINOF|nr:hypothetical protein ZIOFF_057068 [Zingiber officinale]